MRNTIKTLSSIIFLVALTVLPSCNKEERTGTETLIDESIFDDIKVPVTQKPLFADLARYDLNGFNQEAYTRSRGNTVNLNTLVDTRKTERAMSGKIVFIQVPFKNDGTKAMISTLRNGSDASFTNVKKFFIQRIYGTERQNFVATMIPTPAYQKSCPGFSFNYRPDYSGIIIYAKTDGRVFETRRYQSGRIIRTQFVRSEAEAEEFANVLYIFMDEKQNGTRSGEITGWDGDPAYCVADDWEAWWRNQKKKHETTSDYEDWYQNYEHDTDDHDTGDEGGGGGNGNDGDDGKRLEGEYLVSLACNIPEAIILTGGGAYTKGKKVTIGYQYTEEVTPPQEPKFKRWSGFFAGRPKAFEFTMPDKDVEGYAYYDWYNNGPCMTKEGKSVPLMEMYIAPSNIDPDKAGPKDFVNWKGGTFGKELRTDENGKKKDHNGLDIAAEPGTEIFAMYDGVIESVYTTARKGREGKDDNFKYGNDIRIKSTLPDGTTITVIYAHLDYDNPIATNPMTGQEYVPGQNVYAGETVAFSGISGNAYNVPNPHVHVEVRNKYNTPIDPKPYINGTYDANNLKDNKGKITGTKCE